MIVLLKNMDDIVEAHAYLVNYGNGTLCEECAKYKIEKKDPDVFPDTVRNNKHKILMTVGDKDSDLLVSSYGYNSRSVNHYGDISIWASETELGKIQNGYAFFIWMKTADGSRFCYILHPYKFIRTSTPSNIFAKYVKGDSHGLWSISLAKNDTELINENFLRRFDLN